MEDIRSIFSVLHDKSKETLRLSLSGNNLETFSKNYQFASELDIWHDILSSRKEAELLKFAAVEYNFAMFALAQGHYRNCFKALRLVLELTLQSIFLSSNEISLREWLDNRSDTNWSAIVGEYGVFSTRFADAFFPDLRPHISHYQSLATSIYRECSECVHGNIPKCIPLKLSLDFNQELFDLWNIKADVVSLVLHFSISLRYLRDLHNSDIKKIEPILSDRIGHIKEIRMVLGGSV